MKLFFFGLLIMFFMSVQSRFIAKRYPEYIMLPWVFVVSMLQVMVIRGVAMSNDFMSAVDYSCGTVIGALVGTRLVNDYLYYKIKKKDETK